MSNALVSLIIIALMLTAVMLWSQTSLNMMDSSVQSWKQMVETTSEVSRTDINILSANCTAGNATVLVQNTGKLHIGKFSDWDVFVQHYAANGTLYIGSLTYTESSSPSADEWTVANIYTDDTLTQTEIFEPDIINPGEVAKFELWPDPQPGANKTNLVSISSPNGITASLQFEG